MKYIILIIVVFTGLFLALPSCGKKDKVEYNKIAEIDMGNLKKETAKLNAIVLFNNISEESFIVKNLVLDLKIDGKDIGTVVVKNPKSVRPHSEFSLEIDYPYETSRIINTGEEPSDVYLIQLDGDLTLKDDNGQELTVPVSYKASYAYRTAKEERVEKRKERKDEKKKAKEEKQKMKSD